jgi:signal transduction histidine kinase
MNRPKGEFLANMSHELRTPLNSVIGFSEVLQSLDALNDKQKRYAQNIQKAGRQLLEMINDILDLAKLEAGKMEVRLSEFRLENVIAEQCDLVRDMAEEKNIDVRVEIAHELPLLYQDQTKVQQILTNLLSNAIKFTPEGGRISVGARSDAHGQIEFWVADTGVGIPPSEKDIIFEKFRQGKAVLGRDNLTREYSGTGLGLSIVKELCKLLGGEVSVESELGKGSIFRVVLPWMRTDTAAAGARLAARLDDVARPHRLESLRAELAPAEVIATGAGRDS